MSIVYFYNDPLHHRYQIKFDLFAKTALRSLTTPFDLHMYTMSSTRSNSQSAISSALPAGAAGEALGEQSLLEYYVDARTGMFASWRDAGLVERIYSSLGPSIDLPLGSERDHSRQSAASDRSLACSAHTQKYLHLFDLLLGAEHPLLVAGASGVGKSAFLEVDTDEDI